MKAHACPKCGRFLKATAFTHTGGNCGRCGQHIVPAWFTTACATRPWQFLPKGVVLPDSTGLVATGHLHGPWDHTGQPGANIPGFLNVELGLELPDDASKIYWPPYWDEPEYGPADFDSKMASFCSGQVGVDDLHNALLVVCGSAATAGGQSMQIGVQLANLCYYMATSSVAGGTGQELIAEQRIRKMQGVTYLSMQDAVAMAFSFFDVVHPVSTEYMMVNHPDHLLSSF